RRPGQRPRAAISFDHSLRERGAKGGGGKVTRRGGQGVSRSDYHRNCAAGKILAGRGLSSGLLSVESESGLLLLCDRAKDQEARAGAEGGKVVRVAVAGVCAMIPAWKTWARASS